MSTNAIKTSSGINMFSTHQWRKTLANQIPLLVLIGLCLFSMLMSDRFLSSTNITNILLQTSVLAVITLGMTYVVIGGGFDLSV